MVADAPVAPMEALLVDALPEGPGWYFEPKWDGFRAVAERDGDHVELWSKSGKPLARYFPEVAARLLALPERRFLLDGELVIPIGDRLSFDALQARLHPAASRIARLSQDTPAQLILFDCLGVGDCALAAAPLSERREALARFHARMQDSAIILSPYSTDPEDARRWLADAGGALDGVIAKPADAPYQHGLRAMRKIKQLRTADCVVGGYRSGEDGLVASLLLGLFDDAGKLDHVGFTSAFPAAERRALAPLLGPHRGGPGFTGKAPGGPSRWNAGKDHGYVALAHDLVLEIVYDQITAGRFRHGTRFLRWRPDKAPAACTREQLVRELRPAELMQIVGS